jgi:pyruvate ferredoxin oxidoreductase alpha subunit
VIPDKTAQEFIGEFRPVHNLLDSDKPFTFGPLDFHDYYFEHKVQQVKAMEKAPNVIESVGIEYGKLTGRKYGLIDTYKTEDAERIMIALGSTCGTIKAVVNELRDKGEKVGLLKVRSFRPFPVKEVREALAGAKAVAVLDRSVSFGAQGGPVMMEVRSALYGETAPPIKGYIYGLGGRDIKPDHIKHAFNEVKKNASSGKSSDETGFLGVRE